MKFNLECEQETDGRWLAEVPEVPGALCYGGTANEAMSKAEALALRAIAEQLEAQESEPLEINLALAVAA